MRLVRTGATRALVAAGSASLFAIALFAPAANAGLETLAAPLTVVKTVTGPVPAGTTFTATVQCTDDIIDTGDGSTDQATMQFDAVGQPLNASTIGFTNEGSCTVTETATGGATTTTYACEGSFDDELPDQESELSASQAVPIQEVCETTGPGPITVNIFSEGQEALVTIHNTFTTLDPGPQAAPQVVAQPAFTG
jgi:hypothetical protein